MSQIELEVQYDNLREELLKTIEILSRKKHEMFNFRIDGVLYPITQCHGDCFEYISPKYSVEPSYTFQYSELTIRQLFELLTKLEDSQIP